MSMARQFFERGASPSAAQQMRPHGIMPMGMPNLNPAELMARQRGISPLPSNMQEIWSQARMQEDLSRQWASGADLGGSSWTEEFKPTSQPQVEHIQSPAVAAQNAVFSSQWYNYLVGDQADASSRHVFSTYGDGKYGNGGEQFCHVSAVCTSCS